VGTARIFHDPDGKDAAEIHIAGGDRGNGKMSYVIVSHNTRHCTEVGKYEGDRVDRCVSSR
jgi:hypothetical protein